MATTSINPNNGRMGQRLLIDLGRMTIRRVSRSESAIMSALKSLAPGERATLTAMVDVLGAKRRKGRTPGAAPTGAGGDA